MRSRLVCYFRENPKVSERRDPEDQVKDKSANKFREYYLPVANRRSRERLDSAELKFSANKRIVINGKIKTNANQKKTELRTLLDCVLHLALVHERDLEIKIDPADDQKKDHHDVRDREIEIAAHFAGEQGPEFTHWTAKWSDGVLE
jgi:hypothetical protein